MSDLQWSSAYYPALPLPFRAAGRGFSVSAARFFLELFVRPGANFPNRPAKAG